MRRLGKKGKAWEKARKELKPYFDKLGIRHCEICGSTFALSYAHRLKRRFITDEQELKQVALLCQNCHNRIEVSGHENMFNKISEIIEARNEQY